MVAELAEGGGDSVEAARPVPTRTWTVSVKKPPGRAPDAVRAALQVYTRKLRARLRSGVKHRKGGAGYKVNAANVAARGPLAPVNLSCLLTPFLMKRRLRR
jgi:hypothetical protein